VGPAGRGGRVDRPALGAGDPGGRGVGVRCRGRRVGAGLSRGLGTHVRESPGVSVGGLVYLWVCLGVSVSVCPCVRVSV